MKKFLKILNIIVNPLLIEKTNNFKNRLMWNAYEQTLQYVGIEL